MVDTVGKYHFTVVAYNGAMDPSLPVCSDGVIIDQTPPEVFGVHLSNAFMRDGLVKLGMEFWYINRHGYKQELHNTTECW